MGIDFIEEKSKGHWDKSWNKELDALRQPTLFNTALRKEERTLTVASTLESSPPLATRLILETTGGRVVLSTGHTVVGKMDNPPASVLAWLAERSGTCSCTVVRIGTFGDTFEVEIDSADSAP